MPVSIPKAYPKLPDIVRSLTQFVLICVSFTPAVLSAEVRLAKSSLADMSQPPTMYAGFANLLDDENVIVEEELLDIEKDIQRIAFYHTGDRLHREIPKQVHLMVENKLLGRFMGLGRFEVVDCIECRSTKVDFSQDKMRISQRAEDNQALRRLSKEIRADAFLLWNASVHEDKFTVNLRMVNSQNNNILWIKEHSKKTTREEESREFETIDYEILISTWGIGGERDAVSAGTDDAELESVTSFGIRRREKTSLNEDIEYTLGFEYFSNFSQTEQFDVGGFNLEGRIFVNIEAIEDWIKTSAYLGIGQAFFSGAHGLMLKFGLELPFVTNGFMSLGGVYLAPGEVEWSQDADYVDKSEFGGTGLDLTLGFRF